MKTIVKGKYAIQGMWHLCTIKRDQWGHFYIHIDGKVVHKKVNAAWIVCWFAWVFFEEVKLGGQR